ncbi:SGNH/GDSL hydrolase family protein [Chitinophaga qingshengii]|uniref:SGNH/GDSL hydrolase family protein n=1 Tax=Chitinophaga qingshengii TaxID=1569794 RepID=A0ABR7TGM4_9BACT|nr:SGNH/GDSL hydrolase family protein [Chitinophaga qingshengii]MBC9929569.1 SGNH/GDSL hydrolase family protein [Chitinophaga qingshengii]
MMNKTMLSLTALLLCCCSLFAQTPTPLVYHDAMEFPVIGKYHGEHNYNRLPAKYEKTVRPVVWNLSRNAAGIAIRFRTNATTIGARWKVLNNTSLNHMTATGVRGLDLYALVGDKWQFVNSAIPENSFNSERTILKKGDGAWREYVLFLPLYDGVDSLAIGVNAGAAIEKPQQSLLMDKKPIVYYGSSIAQGGCATRPGMAYTNILARQLQRPIVNLGFSGNGMFETAVGEAICETDPSLIVIDCNPNTAPELIHERAVKLVEQIRACKPQIPLLLVENFTYEHAYFEKDIMDIVYRKRAELKKAYDDLKKAGVKNLHYLGGEGFLGDDHEGTVDGVHPTDVGMERFAAHIYPTLRKLTKGQ